MSHAVQPATARTLTVITVHGDTERLPVRRFLWCGWLLGAAILLVRSAAGHVGAAAIARRAKILPRASVFTTRVSREIDVPLVCGLWRPVILLPCAAGSWTPELLAVVIRHEEAHTLRHDTLWQAISDAARALYWPLPWVWWAAAHLRTEAELACDDAVLLTGERASDYAGHLIDIVRDLPGRERIPEGAIPMARLSDLEVRLRAMLSAHRSRGPAGRRVVVAAALLALCLLVPLAALRVSASAAAHGISGVVKDVSGARVPGARVLLTFSVNDRKEVATSNDTGEFSFSPLPDGEYQVQVSKAGFALLELSGIELENGQSTPLEIVLQAGKIRETITVAEDEPSIASKPVAPIGPPQRIRGGGNLQNVKLSYKVNPAYPADCKAEGIQGSVLLRAVISREGFVMNLEALNQLVDPRLVAAAVDAVKQWRYEPTLLNGEPIEVVTEVDVNYVLKK